MRYIQIYLTYRGVSGDPRCFMGKGRVPGSLRGVSGGPSGFKRGTWSSQRISVGFQRPLGGSDVV